MADKYRLTTNMIRFQLEALGSTNLSEAGLTQFLESIAGRFNRINAVLSVWYPTNEPERSVKREILMALDAGDLGAAELKMRDIHSIARNTPEPGGSATNRRAAAVEGRPPSPPGGVKLRIQ